MADAAETRSTLVRPLVADDLDTADEIMRVAFGTFRGLPDPRTMFGDTEIARTRFRAAPECAWVAELDGEVVGSVFAAQWGSFGFFGPLSVRPDLWDRGLGSLLLEPVLAAFGRWGLRQAGLFTFASSPKHLGLYQKRGFWPGTLTAVTAKATESTPTQEYALFSSGGVSLDDARELTEQVFPGLDLAREIVAVSAQGLGDTILLGGEGGLDGIAVCHRGAGSEAGSGACYVKFGAVRPGTDAPKRFAQLLDACEAFAAESGLGRLVAGIDTGRLGAYRRLLARGHRTELLGVSMRLHPDRAHFDGPDDYVLDDLR